MDVTDSVKAANAVSSEKPDNSNNLKDPNLVDWDGPSDIKHPHNFTNLRKWVITLTMSSMAVWVTFASSVLSAATMITAKEFNVSTEVMILGTSLTVFGFALGPLCWAPLSELYGRRVPLFLGYSIFTIFQIPVAVVQNVQTILVCRFLVGVFGCSSLAVISGAMADIWNPVDRGVAIALLTAGVYLGPVLAPIV
jgi:DHA1 family multidrug resistance protein-like MFS transporter